MDADLNEAELRELGDGGKGALPTVLAGPRHWELLDRLLAEVRRRRREDAREVYTTGTLAKLLGYSEFQVRAMCEAGRFPGAFRNGPHAQWRVPPEAVAAFKDATRPRLRRRAG